MKSKESEVEMLTIDGWFLMLYSSSPSYSIRSNIREKWRRKMKKEEC
jgi:hypothetical protein